MTGFAVGLIAGLLAAWLCTAVALADALAARRRCWKYACDRVNERDLLDPEACAYSDMAAVIVLDGKAEPRTHTTHAPSEPS